MDNNANTKVNLDLNESSAHHLAMQWSFDSFYYTILDITEKKYLTINNIPLTGNRTEKSKILNQTFTEHGILSRKYASACLLAQSYKAMLVPETLFDSKNLNAFLKFHHEIDDKDHIHFVPVKPAEAFIVFSVPAYVEEILEKCQPGVKYSHHSHPLIDHAIRFTASTDPLTNLNIHFGKDFFDVLITRNNKILLFNSFFYQKYSDVVYFIVNILNLFSLHPDHSRIKISGLVDVKSEIETELGKIFKNIQFSQFSLDFKYSEAMYTIPQHTLVNLLNLYNCES